MDNSKTVGWKVKGVEYKHRDVRVSTPASQGLALMAQGFQAGPVLKFDYMDSPIMLSTIEWVTLMSHAHYCWVYLQDSACGKLSRLGVRENLYFRE